MHSNTEKGANQKEQGATCWRDMNNHPSQKAAQAYIKPIGKGANIIVPSWRLISFPIQIPLKLSINSYLSASTCTTISTPNERRQANQRHL